MRTAVKAGLEEAAISTSEIRSIDGHRGRLQYRGFDRGDLVAHPTFEEVGYSSGTGCCFPEGV